MAMLQPYIVLASYQLLSYTHSPAEEIQMGPTRHTKKMTHLRSQRAYSTHKEYIYIYISYFVHIFYEGKEGVRLIKSGQIKTRDSIALPSQ